MWGGAMVLLGALTAALGWLLIGRSTGPGPPVTVTPLATYPGVKDFPAISPDGSAVAFSWRKPGTDNFDLYVLQVGGGPPVQPDDEPGGRLFRLVVAGWTLDRVRARLRVRCQPDHRHPDARRSRAARRVVGRRLLQARVDGRRQAPDRERSHRAWCAAVVVQHFLDTEKAPLRDAARALHRDR